MRRTPNLFATLSSSSPVTAPLKSQPLALLPPIPLYRRLLRAHRRKLPRDMRLLGDEYVKSEFRAHQKIDNPVHIVSSTLVPVQCLANPCPSVQIGFLIEWQLYAQKLEGDTWTDEILEPEKLDKMSGELFVLIQSCSLF